MRCIPKLVVAALLSLPSLAAAFDRVAVERLEGETDWDAAVAFERACWRLGSVGVGARPAQPFDIGGRPFVRLQVSGHGHPPRCLDALDGGRRGVDGSITWFDGFVGGALVPSPEEERIEDAAWYDPEVSYPAPSVDADLVSRLARGDAQALETMKELDLASAHAHLVTLLQREDAGVGVAMEQVARHHPHPRIRRIALGRLKLDTSFEVLVELAKKDDAWDVRQAAVFMLGRIADRPVAARDALVELAERTVMEALVTDAATEVRFAAALTFPPGRVGAFKSHFRRVSREDTAADVRGAAMEALAKAGELTRPEARDALGDSAAPVRAVGAAMLSFLMGPEDVPLLWRAMNDEERIVRLAAGMMADRVDDPTLSEPMWSLYLREAQEADAQPEYLQALLGAMARQPFAGLGAMMGERLSQPLAPVERRLLASALARVDGTAASALIEKDLASTEVARRVAAAYALVDSPSVREERLKLLEDEFPEVRAAAAIGLCRTPGFSDVDRVKQTDLIASALGHEAARLLGQCGKPAPEPKRIATRVLGPDGQPLPQSSGGAPWVAILAMVLLLGSVVITKLSGSSDGA